MTLFKRIAITVCAALFLFALVPASSFAVDPVSAATMANAFAQAITAYGASQGVSMTFDVANTDGIGEGVHDLWNQYAEDMAQSNVTVSDYSNLSASVFPTLWKKTFDYVTVSLDAATVGEIDGFWNWLLSGPAEMTKVDNAYYEWSVNQNNTVDPISVLAISTVTFNGYDVHLFPFEYQTSQNDSKSTAVVSGNGYWIKYYRTSTPTAVTVYYFSDTPLTISTQNYYNGSAVGNPIVNNQNSATNGYYTFKNQFYDWQTDVTDYDFSGIAYQPNLDTLLGALTADSVQSEQDSISVRPYVGDIAPQNVYIPDNTDVNYNPVAAEIPLDILWDDTLFGDGTGTLTDAQSEAITEAADSAITDNPAKTLELVDTDTPPGPHPSEVYIPLLPVTLPSFNFSFSGIWHYVVTWVGSLGSWLTLMFSVWNSLPYAIVIPVYASAVVVIIIGTLKRFL